MKSVLIFSVTFTLAFVIICSGDENVHLTREYYGLHSQHGIVPVEGNKIAVYRVEYPLSVS